MGRQTDNKMSVWTILLCLLILLKGIVAEEAGPTPPPMYISSTLYNQSFHNIILDVYAKSEGVPSECRKGELSGVAKPSAIIQCYAYMHACIYTYILDTHTYKHAYIHTHTSVYIHTY